MNEDWIVVVVLWCLQGTPMDAWNPHQVGTATSFVDAHPSECHREPAAVLPPDLGVSLEQCRRQQMINAMPGWLQRPGNEGKLYLGADCEPYGANRREPLDLQALKERVTP